MTERSVTRDSNARRKLPHQIGLALSIGLCAACFSWLMYPLDQGSDFSQFHYHARVWLAGRDAYVGGVPIMRNVGVVPEPFFYPFPTLLAIVPFAWLSVRAAAATFVAVSSTILAYATLRRSPQRLPLFLGAGFIAAVILGQWSPLITATLLWPALSWLAPIKPNLGLAVTAAKPTWLRTVGSAALLGTTVLIQPSWPREWLHNLHAMPSHPPPILVPGGILVLLALARWRRGEARLLVAMACVPQLLYFADQLPLWLVPQTRRESLTLSALSIVAWATALTVTLNAGWQPAYSSSWFVLGGVYLPAVIMVLRRPNEGRIPAWLERLVSRAPAWARGRAVGAGTADAPWQTVGPRRAATASIWP